MISRGKGDVVRLFAESDWGLLRCHSVVLWTSLPLIVITHNIALWLLCL